MVRHDYRRWVGDPSGHQERARPGDGVWVTGVLGAARAAVEAWRRSDEPASEARSAFARPVPRIEAGRWLASAGAHAMIDVSDGLGGDVQHLASQSDVAIELDLDAVPASLACRQEARRLGVAPQEFAAEGGEDYELLVALPPEFDAGSAASFARECGLPITRVGVVRAGTGVRARFAGREVTLAGYDHFR